MNNLWAIDIDTYFLIYDLAVKHGKKPGDSMQAEFEEIQKQYPEKFRHVGQTDKDIDQLTGDLREAGKKVLNMNEIERRKKKNGH